MNTFDLSLDLDKRAGVTQWVTMRQGDHDGTQLRATIYDHGTQVSDSYTCRVSIRKPTDNEYYRETCSFSGGVAIVTVDEQYAASEVGITYGYFELLQGTAVIASTENFGVRILQSATDGAIVAPPYDSAIEDALAELDEATGRISQMVVDATAEYLEAHPEITTTVEDNSLTDAKLIQKGGILSREQWLETMLPNIPRKATSESDVHSVTDSAGGGPLGISVYGRSTQGGTPTPSAPVAIQSVGPDSDGGVKLVAAGANMAALPYINNRDAGATGTFANGITWTVNADGSITLDGTATATGGMDLLNQGWSHVGNVTRGMAYTFSCDSNLVRCKAWAQGSGGDRFAYGSITQTIPLTGSWNFGINIPSGTVLSNVVVRPQLERGEHVHEWAPPTVPTTIPIDLGGRSLRSLPDGTRDEVTVDQYGHAILTQRVGTDVWDGSSDENWRAYSYTSGGGFYIKGEIPYAGGAAMQGKALCSNFPIGATTGGGDNMAYFSISGDQNYIRSSVSGVSAWREYLAEHPITIIYQLKEPVSIDLGYLDPALLPAPDLTAYVVPSAPSVLRYGFDVAAALAEIATA